MKVAYKLFKKRKNGTIGSILINKKEVLKEEVWLKAKKIKTKGFKERSGWHCVDKKYAPHLSKKGRLWKKVLIKNFKIKKVSKKYGSIWYLAKSMKIKK